MAYLDEISQVWHMVRETFRPELSDVITDLWLGGLEVMDFQGSTVTLKADSEVKIRVVTSKYKTDIENRFAEMLGFDDPLYFSKKFKSYYGASPSEYRKANS
jgi:hypothetical protein